MKHLEEKATGGCYCCCRCYWPRWRCCSRFLHYCSHLDDKSRRTESGCSGDRGMGQVCSRGNSSKQVETHRTTSRVGMRRTGLPMDWAKGTGAWVGSVQRTGSEWGVGWAEAAAGASSGKADRTGLGRNAQPKRETAQGVGSSFRGFGTKTTRALGLSLPLGSEHGEGVGFLPGTLSPY